MQEIIGKRTRNSKHFDIGNGQIQAILTKHDQHYHDGTDWQDIDTTWEIEAGFGRKIKKAKHNLRIHTQGIKKTLRFGFSKGIFVDYTIPNIPGNYSGSVCTFIDSWTNTDLVYTVTPEGIKNDIILKTIGHPSSLSFPIQTTGCTTQLEGNSLVFYSSGNIIGKIPAPYMEDANGEIGSVALDYDGNNVRFVPDPIWLTSAAYPVTIDPTTIIQPDATVGKDAALVYRTTDGAFGDNNLGSVPVIPIGWDSNIYPNEGVLEFDLSSVPPNSLVTSCLLELYMYTYAGLLTNTCDISFKNFSTSWVENTITWNNKPIRRATPLTTFTGFTGTMNAMNSFNITTNAQDWITSGNNGLYIFDPNPYVNNNKKGFKSSDDATASNRPKLTVIYTTGSTNATVNAVTATTQTQAINPTVSASVNITSPSMTSITNAITPTVTSDCNITAVVINTNSNALIPVITAENNYKKSPLYKWKELLQNYIIQELKQNYKTKELPENYTWKELK